MRARGARVHNEQWEQMVCCARYLSWHHQASKGGATCHAFRHHMPPPALVLTALIRRSGHELKIYRQSRKDVSVRLVPAMIPHGPP